MLFNILMMEQGNKEERGRKGMGVGGGPARGFEEKMRSNRGKPRLCLYLINE